MLLCKAVIAAANLVAASLVAVGEAVAAASLSDVVVGAGGTAAVPAAFGTRAAHVVGRERIGSMATVDPPRAETGGEVPTGRHIFPMNWHLPALVPS